MVFLLLLIQRFPVGLPAEIGSKVYQFMKECLWEESRKDYISRPCAGRSLLRPSVSGVAEAAGGVLAHGPLFQMDGPLFQMDYISRRAQQMDLDNYDVDERPRACDILKEALRRTIWFSFTDNYGVGDNYNYNAIGQFLDNTPVPNQKKKSSLKGGPMLGTLEENKSKTTHFRKNEKFMFKKGKKNKRSSARIHLPNTKQKMGGRSRSGCRR